METMGIIFPIAVAVFMCIVNWKIYEKAGKPGWAALVPIYNAVVFLEIIGKPIWWILLLFIPFVNFVIAIICVVELAKAFGKDAVFAIGMLLVGVVFYPLLAFGDAQYQGPSN